MTPFTPASHVDAELERFGHGLTTPAEHRRMAEHARGCERCARRLHRLALARRALERGSPFEPTEDELASVEGAGLETALRAARPAQSPRTGWLFSLAGMATAAGLALLVTVRAPSEPAEFAARGGRPASPAVFRTFCARDGQPLVELGPGAGCPAGASLAFAASAAPPLSHVAVLLRDRTGTTLSQGPFPVGGRPGAETPLPATPRLELSPGPAELVAAFASSPAAATEALRAGPGQGVVVLRYPLRVEARR